MPLRIEPTPLYPDIILALNTVTHTPPQYHWLLYIPDRDQDDENMQQGYKVHAIRTRNPDNPWSFSAVTFTLPTSRSVLAAAVIGQLKDKTMDQLIEVVRPIPLTVPAVDQHRERNFTCRVWMREALRRLHDAGFIHCPDVDAMEKEMWEYGAPASQAMKNGTFRVAKLVTAKNSCIL